MKTLTSIFFPFCQECVVRRRLINGSNRVFPILILRQVRTSLRSVQGHLRRRRRRRRVQVLHGHLVHSSWSSATTNEFVTKPPKQNEQNQDQDDSDDSNGDPDAELTSGGSWWSSSSSNVVSAVSGTDDVTGLAILQLVPQFARVSRVLAVIENQLVDGQDFPLGDFETVCSRVFDRFLELKELIC